MLALSQLHDATLNRIELSWESGEAKLHIQTYVEGKNANIEIVLRGLTSIQVPRYNPWGPSASINKAWEENSGEALKLIIEMQSGDVIEARVSSFILQKS
jgi:hypothetical protein